MNPSDEYAAFVSYASENRERAEDICANLERRGLVCWIAPRDVRAGREYADEIIRGIERAASVVLVLSDAANTSVFVRREVERAISKQKPVFPVRIEEVTPSPGLELFISGTHWIDAWTGPWDDHMDRLARDLTDRPADVQPERSVRPRSLETYSSFRKAHVAAGVALLVAVIGLAVWSFSGDEEPQRIQNPGVQDSAQRDGTDSKSTVEAQRRELTDRAEAPAVNAPAVSGTTTTRRTTQSRRQVSTQVTAEDPPVTTASPAVVVISRELNAVSDAYDAVAARGDAIDTALNQLWEDMKPMSPRVDVVTHQRALKATLARSRDALTQKDASEAKRHLEIARGHLEALEEFLNR